MATISNSQQAQNKQLCARIKYTRNKAYDVYNSCERSLNPDWSNAVSELTNLYNYANGLFSQMLRYDNAGVFREDYYGQAKNHLDAIRKYLTDAKNRANADRTKSDDPRTAGFTDNSELGQQIGQLADLFGGQPYNGSDPNMAALYDLYMQLLGQRQQYDWQRESDDLAYQRTNFFTLLSQYQSAGMSRAAALAAASGQLPATAGSTVGGSLAPAMLDSVLGAGNLGVAQQQANTAQWSAAMNAHNEQNRIAIESYNSRMANIPNEIMKKGFDEIQETWNLTYGMHARGVNVPTYATDSQKAYKDWCRDGRDRYVEAMESIANGDVVRDVNGNYYLADENGERIMGTLPIFSDDDLTSFELRKGVYEEIQKHIDSIAYGLMFENLFMCNAGPRAYHQQEDESQLRHMQINAEKCLAHFDELSTMLASEELAASVTQQFHESYLNLPTDAKNRVDHIMSENHYVFNAQGVPCVELDGELEPVPVRDLCRVGLIDVGFNYSAMLSMRGALQAGMLATDSEHFEAAFKQMHLTDAIGVAQLETQSGFWNGAAIQIKNSAFLEKAGVLKTIISSCGFDRVAAAAFGLGFSAFKGGMSIASMVQAQRNAHAHHMTESYDSNGNLTTSESWIR